MSNPLARIESMPDTLQLPVSWYVDPAIYDLELEHVFAPGPGYVGHGSMVPEVGSYHVLDWKADAWMLVRNAEGVDSLSNISPAPAGGHAQRARDGAEHRVPHPPLVLRPPG